MEANFNPQILTVVFVAALVAVVIFASRNRDLLRHLRPQAVTHRSECYPEIDHLITRLARQSWPSREAASGLVFEFQIMNAASDLDIFVKDLLRHVRQIAPRLNVPLNTPRTVIEPIALAAGQFVEEDGWVKIAVSSNYRTDQALMRSILCHEICHYVLNAHGIRDDDTNRNERLTDVAMFVFGLGGLFMEGYRSGGNKPYRPGHKLGYLKAGEYAYARQRSFDLWRSGQLARPELLDLERQFRAAIPDAVVRQRLLDHERAKVSDASEVELIERVLASYRADRH